MYQPQGIICEHCGHQGQIITEGIRVADLTVVSAPSAPISQLVARVECPCCHQKFDLVFTESQRTGSEIMYVCDNQQNGGLELWRRWENGIPKQPGYTPNYAGRNPSEQGLDALCKRTADNLVEWQERGVPGQGLEQILSRVEDYTKDSSWKNFRKKHLVVVVCGNGMFGNIHHGFSGKFAPVHYKNPGLMNAMRQNLGAEPEEKSNQFCNNLVGHCAEVHATNSYLYYDQHVPLNQLEYSIAYLVRNAMPQSYCMNCIALFNLRNA